MFANTQTSSGNSLTFSMEFDLHAAKTDLRSATFTATSNFQVDVNADLHIRPSVETSPLSLVDQPYREEFAAAA